MFEKAFTEVNEILENMDESYVNQISKSFRRMIIENMDLNYQMKCYKLITIILVVEKKLLLI